MKNTVIILLAFFTISEAFSQENKKWWIGGTIGGAYEKGDRFNFEMTTKTWSLGQEIGMRFGNRFATGINVAFRQYKQESERLVTQEIKRASINTSGFLRYYISDKEKLKLFGQLNLGYTYIDDGNYLSDGLMVNFQPGIQYFLNENWAIQSTFGKLGYDYSKSRTTESSTSNLGLDLSLSSLAFGVLFNF